jgi:hypothetical protein
VFAALVVARAISWSFCVLAQLQIARYAPRGFTVLEKTLDATLRGKATALGEEPADRHLDRLLVI